jgi:hypothetical protein
MSSWQPQVVEVARDLEALVRSRHARLVAVTLAAPARLPRRAVIAELCEQLGVEPGSVEFEFVDRGGPLRVISAEFEPLRSEP